MPATATWAQHSAYDNNWLDDNYEIDNSRQPPFAIGDPGSNFYYRAKDGAGRWNAISGSGLDFNYQQQRSMSQTLSASSVDFDETWVMDYWTAGANGIWNIPSSGNPNGKVLGTIDVDGNGGIDRALIKINHDDDINWEWTTGSPSSSELHLFSVMVHEFGHAVGFPDFQSGSSECNSWFTMCGFLGLGDTYQSTISSHEQGDVAEQY